MKQILAAFSLASMLPATVNAAAVNASQLTAPLCNSAGETVTIFIPGRPQLPRRSGDEGCCVKGCHGGSSRKRVIRDN